MAIHRLKEVKQYVGLASNHWGEKQPAINMSYIPLARYTNTDGLYLATKGFLDKHHAAIGKIGACLEGMKKGSIKEWGLFYDKPLDRIVVCLEFDNRRPLAKSISVTLRAMSHSLGFVPNEIGHIKALRSEHKWSAMFEIERSDLS